MLASGGLLTILDRVSIMARGGIGLQYVNYHSKGRIEMAEGYINILLLQ